MDRMDKVEKERLETFVDISLGMRGGIPQKDKDTIARLESEVKELLKSADFEIDFEAMDQAILPFQGAQRVINTRVPFLLSKIYKDMLYFNISKRLLAYKNKDDSSNESEEAEEEESELEPQTQKKLKQTPDEKPNQGNKRKPGRPPGSKNKHKDPHGGNKDHPKQPKPDGDNL